MFLPFFFLVLHQYCQRTFFNLSPLARKLRAADLFRKAGAKISDLFAKLQIFSLKILKVFSGPKLLPYLSISFKSLTVFENAVDVSQAPWPLLLNLVSYAPACRVWPAYFLFESGCKVTTKILIIQTFYFHFYIKNCESIDYQLKYSLPIHSSLCHIFPTNQLLSYLCARNFTFI